VSAPLALDNGKGGTGGNVEAGGLATVAPAPTVEIVFVASDVAVLVAVLVALLSKSRNPMDRSWWLPASMT